MSSKKEINKIKEHLGRSGEQSGRQVFGRAVKRIPWYSPYRFHNMVILAVMISAVVMSKPLFDLYHGIRRGIKYERERSKFLKQLDEEDRQAEKGER